MGSPSQGRSHPLGTFIVVISLEVLLFLPFETVLLFGKMERTGPCGTLGRAGRAGGTSMGCRGGRVQTLLGGAALCL